MKIPLFFKINKSVIYCHFYCSRGRSLNIARTTITSFDFPPQFKVQNGHIMVAQNAKLCYVDKINWNRVKIKDSQIVRVGYNKNETDCSKSCVFTVCMSSKYSPLGLLIANTLPPPRKKKIK